MLAKSVLKKIKKIVGELFFGSQCSFCYKQQAPHHFLCDECIASLSPFSGQDVVSDDGEYPVISLFPINELTTKIVYDIKYNQLPGFSKTLIKQYQGQGLENNIPNNSIIIPVPLHARRMRERGYNQALVIAEAVSQKTKTMVNKNILKRARHTGTQTALSKDSRRENMKGAFYISKKYQSKGEEYVLVDDVYTTGATTEACVSALKTLRPKSITVFTLLRTDGATKENDFQIEQSLS